MGTTLTCWMMDTVWMTSVTVDDDDDDDDDDGDGDAAACLLWR